MAGYDQTVGEDLMIGGAVGYGRTTLTEQDGGKGSLTTPRLMLYGRYQWSAITFDASLSYAYDKIDALRPGLSAPLASNHNGQEFAGAFDARTSFDFEGATVAPVAGLQFVRLFESAFAEKSTAFDAVAASSRSSTSLQPFVGLSVGETFTTSGGLTFIPQFDISYAYESEAAMPSLLRLAGNSFSIDGITPSRDRLSLGGRLTAMLDDQLSLFVAYQTVLPIGNLTEETVSAGLNRRF